MKCWICNDIADTKEHKFKASDLRRLFGKKNKFNRGYKSENKIKPLKDHNDNKLIFESKICANCNNEITQPHDFAYDKFIKNIDNYYDDILESKSVQLKKIFGEEWVKEKNNLFKYFCKHVGCRIISYSDKYTSKIEGLKNFILTDTLPDNVKFHLVIKPSIYSLEKHYLEEKIQHLHNGTLVLVTHNTGQYFHSWLSYRWISIHWVFSIHNKIRSTLFTEENDRLFFSIQDPKVIMDRKPKDDIIDFLENHNLDNNYDRINYIEMILKSKH